MTRIIADPRRQRYPSFYRTIIIDTYRGQMRARAWPRKRGRPKSKWVRVQNAWFKEAQRLAKHAPASQRVLAINAVQGTLLHPRDILVKTISEGMFDIIEPDGRLIQYRRPFLEDDMFQGCILELDADQALPPFVTTWMTWPVPVIDTFGFWSAGAPKRLTIPPGVEVIALTAGWADKTGAIAAAITSMIAKNGVPLTRDAVTGTGTPGHTTGRGALTVALGDYFEFGVYPGRAYVTWGDYRTFMTLQVLQAA